VSPLPVQPAKPDSPNYVSVAAGPSWTKLSNAPAASVGAMLLLTDGRVLFHEEPNCSGTGCSGMDYTAWFLLTPDITGSYINGTWSQAAGMPPGYAPLYFGSAVLADGKVIVEGGEYQCPGGQCAPQWTNLGAMYDPAANTWSTVAPPSLPTPWANIGDAESIVLADGTYMQSDCCGVALQMQSAPMAAYFSEATMSWTELNQSTKFDEYDEEGWTLLPNGKVLTVDAYVACPSDQPACAAAGFTGTNSEVWDPGTQTWSSAGSTIVQLWDSNCGAGGGSYEVGPAVLRPDGTVFYTGSSDCSPGHTAVYNSVAGTWSKGPDFPNNDAANDAPAAIETNGNVIVVASPYSGTFSPPSHFYQWNGTSLAAFPAPPNAVNDASFVSHLMVLPTGQIMFTDFTTDVEILTTTGTFKSAWRPTVSSAPKIVNRGVANYSISGTQFNGFTQASAYGDDFQNATNYPLVRIVNNGTGHVFYCKTHNHSSMGVATGTARVSTMFDVPANVEPGAGKLYVVANGIPSAARNITVQ
jgi:ribosomal protein L24E